MSMIFFYGCIEVYSQVNNEKEIFETTKGNFSSSTYNNSMERIKLRNGDRLLLFINTSQKEIKPNSSFIYKILFDYHGIHWYHAHLDENKQIDKALFGTIVINP